MPRAKSDLEDQARTLYKNGCKLADIAKELSVPPGTVRRWKCVYMWDEIPETDGSARIAAMKSKLVRDLVESGWRQTDIADALGVSAGTIWRWKAAYCEDGQAGTISQNTLLSVSRDKIRDYHKNYYRKKTYQQLCSIIKKNFQNAVLLTFLFQPAAPMPWGFTCKYVAAYEKSVRRKFRRRYGMNWEFVRITDCVDLETGKMRFRYITDLTQEQCELVIADWIMGEARAEALPDGDLQQILQPVGAHGALLQDQEGRRRGWSCTRGIKR